jgi:hypothetical protein
VYGRRNNPFYSSLDELRASHRRVFAERRSLTVVGKRENPRVLPEIKLFFREADCRQTDRAL